jgi:hypothetical protein
VPGWPIQVEIIADGADLSEGSIGLYTWFSDGGSFDDILVKDLDTDGVLLWDDFNHDNFANWTIVDEGTCMAPSAWSVSNGTLLQSSKIYSEVTDPADLANYGTYALYTRGW